MATEYWVLSIVYFLWVVIKQFLHLVIRKYSSTREFADYRPILEYFVNVESEDEIDSESDLVDRFNSDYDKVIDVKDLDLGQ